MRMRLAWRGLWRARELRVWFSKGELLERALLAEPARDGAEVFGATQAPWLLPACGCRRRGGGAVLAYEVTGMARLSSFARHGLREPGTLPALLDELARALAQSGGGRGPSGALLLNPRYVFVDESARLRLALLPVTSGVSDAGLSVVPLLQALAVRRRGSALEPADETCRQRLEAFLLQAKDAFSLNRFEEFVCDQRQAADAARSPRATSASPGAYVLRDLVTGMAFALEEGRGYVLGRGCDCDIRVAEHPEVSRSHARIRCVGERVLVVDLGSTNGVFVGGRRCASGMETSVEIGSRFSLAGIGYRVERR